MLDISCQYGGFLYAVGVLCRQSFQYLQKYQMKVILDLYDQIYLSEFAPSLSPFRLRRQLEKELPADSAGETLSINNVLAITRYGITPQQDDFYHLMNGKFCGEAWDAVSRYVYTALQGGSIMKGWTNDDRMMITCCNDGTRPVIFKIEGIDIPENDEEREWLAKQNFKNTAEDAYTG